MTQSEKNRYDDISIFMKRKHCLSPCDNNNLNTEKIITNYSSVNCGQLLYPITEI